MQDLNKCIFTGRIGNDIELKTTKSGISTCTISLAVTRAKAKDADEAETDWIRCIAWRTTAEFIERYLNKGRKVVVEAKVRTRTWEDQDGNNHKETEFHIDNIYPTDSKPQGSGQNDSQSESVSAPKSAPKRAASKAKTEPVPLDPDISDDLPF